MSDPELRGEVSNYQFAIMQRSKRGATGQAREAEAASGESNAAFAENLAQWQVVMDDYYRNMHSSQAKGTAVPNYPGSSWSTQVTPAGASLSCLMG